MACRKTSRGFTLVELLVVITIIGMLVSLLLPAIQAAREAGRRNTCLSNMRQCAMGLIQFAEVKRAFPGYVNVIPKTAGTVPYVRASWVVPILPALEENQRFQNWQSPTLPINASTLVSQTAPSMPGNREAFLAPLAILVCPSNANPDLGDNPLSYVVNTGMAMSANDTTTDDTDTGSGSPVPAGATYLAENVNAGVFFNHSQWDGTTGTTPVGFTQGKKINADFISTNDGTTHTLMMSENLQAVNWATDLVANSAGLSPWDKDMTVRGHTGMVWFVTGNADNRAVVAPTAMFNENAIGINDGGGTAFVSPTMGYKLLYDDTAGKEWEHGGLAFARPSSNHPGGVNVAFCDGHVYYLTDEVEYHVFTQLMTPNQKGAADPAWIYVLSEADY